MNYRYLTESYGTSVGMIEQRIVEGTCAHVCVFVCVCVCVFESLPVKEGNREHVHCTLSQWKGDS